METYRGTPEKQEIVSQVVLSGNLVLDKWHRGGKYIGDNRSPRYSKNSVGRSHVGQGLY
ncbi:MAG: hypothetical protein QNJ70_18650 [Xenococcaceae cyanobacterium MO_207.B15]|nr:hypothetical protein [Xenococcaceae cyanobacterium MO_207.B15]